MGLLGRYFSERDLRFVASINGELMADVIQTEVTVFKVSVNETNTNVYGESDQTSGGITYFPGIEITALIQRDDLNTEYDNFGPDRSQNVIFKFREKMLKLINLYPELDDLIYFNERYYKIDNVVNDEQLIGGQPEKSHSIICHSHYTKLSAMNLSIRNF